VFAEAVRLLYDDQQLYQSLSSSAKKMIRERLGEMSLESYRWWNLKCWKETDTWSEMQ